LLFLLRALRNTKKTKKNKKNQKKQKNKKTKKQKNKKTKTKKEKQTQKKKNKKKKKKKKKKTDIEEMDVEGHKVRAYDLGGKQRDIWSDYLVSSGCVVFVVDASDPDRFPESKAELDVRPRIFLFFFFFLFFSFFSFFIFFIFFTFLGTLGPLDLWTLGPCDLGTLGPLGSSVFFFTFFYFVYFVRICQALLSNVDLCGVPFVVFGNKCDLDEAVSERELRDAMGLSFRRPRPIDVFMCSARGRYGYKSGMRWVSHFF
jgi:signal recognition particle receptor subunit beta